MPDDRAGLEPPPPLRVLVVDDCRGAADALCLLLGRWGHEARAAAGGEQAVAAAARFGPDLVLMDPLLPAPDGCEAARRIAALPGAGSVMLVAVSAAHRSEARPRLHRAGFGFVLPRPFDVTLLQWLLAVGDAAHRRRGAPAPRYR
jgi:CheY-like chemotaxis protein